MAVALIGDVVGSRLVEDRSALQRLLERSLAETSRQTGGSLDMTIGDEFQGRLADLESALVASLRLHLALLPMSRLRIGIGLGALNLETDATSPIGQDGPVWWRARGALEILASEGDVARTRVDTGTDWDPLINAYLRMRDTVVDGFDPVDATIATGLLDGSTQKALAADVKLNQSSVSRRVRRHGVAAVVDCARPELGELGDPEGAT